MTKVSLFTALSTDRVIAHKRYGNNVALLRRVGAAFVLTFAEITVDKKWSIKGNVQRTHFKVLAEKQLTAEQAHEVLLQIFDINGSVDADHSDAGASSSNSGISASAYASTNETLFLELSQASKEVYSEAVPASPIESPYFSTKDIFLSVQKTRGPDTLK